MVATCTFPRTTDLDISYARRALAAGDSIDEIRDVALLAITTCGFPTAIAGLRFIDDVVQSGNDVTSA